MKPLIGITSSYSDDRTLQTSYDNIEAVLSAGGIPIILPNYQADEADIKTYVSQFDGILVTGGGDIDPTLFGEEPHQKLGVIHPNRDRFEVLLLQECLKQNKPILAICRGCQILSIAAGGDMYQDIYSQIDQELLQHIQRAPRPHPSHFIEIEPQSMLYKISGSRKYKVNSFHHQALRNMAEGFQVSARSSDGIIEAFESTAHQFVIGVQWHPECMITSGNEEAKQLLAAFIEHSNSN